MKIVQWGVTAPDLSQVTEGWGWKPGAEPSRFVPAELTGAARVMAIHEAQMRPLIEASLSVVEDVIAQMEA